MVGSPGVIVDAPRVMADWPGVMADAPGVVADAPGVVADSPPSVMAGLVPAIHDLPAPRERKSWMAGPRPAMTLGVAPP
jgi:hypothetical protein